MKNNKEYVIPQLSIMRLNTNDIMTMSDGSDGTDRWKKDPFDPIVGE